MKNSLVNLGSKVIELFTKRSKSGEKKQEIEVKKLDIFSKIIIVIIAAVFCMCILASLFPNLAITDWWFDVADKFINYLLEN